MCSDMSIFWFIGDCRKKSRTSHSKNVKPVNMSKGSAFPLHPHPKFKFEWMCEIIIDS